MRRMMTSTASQEDVMCMCCACFYMHRKTANSNGKPPLLSPFDILCERDKRYGQHHGNTTFRRVIASYQNLYATARSKQEKMNMTREIVHVLRTKHNARFIKRQQQQQLKTKDDEEDFSDWEEISDRDARDKVSHALRCAAAPRRPSPKGLVRARQSRKGRGGKGHGDSNNNISPMSKHDNCDSGDDRKQAAPDQASVSIPVDKTHLDCTEVMQRQSNTEQRIALPAISSGPVALPLVASLSTLGGSMGRSRATRGCAAKAAISEATSILFADKAMANSWCRQTSGSSSDESLFAASDIRRVGDEMLEHETEQALSFLNWDVDKEDLDKSCDSCDAAAQPLHFTSNAALRRPHDEEKVFAECFAGLLGWDEEYGSVPPTGANDDSGGADNDSAAPEVCSDCGGLLPLDEKE